MRLLNLRINFYLLQTPCPHLGSFCVVSSFTMLRPNFTSGLLQVILPRPRIGKTWCDRQQLWKAVITGDTVTRLSIPIRGRGKITWRRPEVKFGRSVVKEETTQKLPRWGQGVCNKWKLILKSNGEVPVMLELWENTEFPFIAIARGSTLSRSGSTQQSPIYGSNRTKLRTYAKLNCLKWNCFLC